MSLVRLVGFLFLILVLCQFVYADRYLIKEVETNVEGTLFNAWFTEPVEVCYLIMKDGTLHKFTSYEEYIVELPIADLKKLGYKISDIVLVIHNHFVIHSFSPADKNVFRRLYQKGFRGTFLLWRYKAKWLKQLIVVEKPALK